MASAGQPLSIVVEDVSRTVTINLDVMQITPAKKDAATISDFAAMGQISACGNKTVNHKTCSKDRYLSRVVGYYEGWSTRRPCHRFWPEQIPLGVYSHINFAFATIDPETYKVLPADNRDKDLYKRIAALKTYDPNVKILIALGGWTFNDPGPTATIFSDLAASETKQKIFFESLINFLSVHDFDGVDLDWEYPEADDRSGKPEDYKNFPTFMENLRKALDGTGGRNTLSITLPASYWYLQHFDLKELAKHVSFFNIMSYDMHGIWDEGNKWTGSYLNAHTNLTEIKQGMDLLWRNDVNPDQVVMGLAFYGRTYTTSGGCVEPGCEYLSGGFAGECSHETGILLNNEIMDIINKRNLESKLYKEATIKVVTWDDQWVSMDDKETLGMKADFAREQCLSGVMVWAISHDTPTADFSRDLAKVSNRQVSMQFDKIDNDTVIERTDHSQCRWTNCAQPCPAGWSMIKRADKWKTYEGEPMMDSTFCLGVGYASFCCPPTSPLPKCGWYGYNDGKCKAGCEDGMLEIGSTNEGCQFDVPQQYQSACCSPTDDNGKELSSMALYNTCEWSEPLVLCDDGKCSGTKDTVLVESSRGSGVTHCSAWNNGERHQHKRKYCCDASRKNKKFENCEWHDGSDLIHPVTSDMRCWSGCPDGQIRVAMNDDGKCLYGGARAYCCDGTDYTETEHLSDELQQFQDELSDWITNAKCELHLTKRSGGLEVREDLCEIVAKHSLVVKLAALFAGYLNLSGRTSHYNRLANIWNSVSNTFEHLSTRYMLPWITSNLTYPEFYRQGYEDTARRILQVPEWYDEMIADSKGTIFCTLDLCEYGDGMCDQDEDTLGLRDVLVLLGKRAKAKKEFIDCEDDDKTKTRVHYTRFAYPGASEWPLTSVQAREAIVNAKMGSCTETEVREQEATEADLNAGENNSPPNINTEHLIEVKLMALFMQWAVKGDNCAVDCGFFADFFTQEVINGAPRTPGSGQDLKRPIDRVMEQFGSKSNKEVFRLLRQSINVIKGDTIAVYNYQNMPRVLERFKMVNDGIRSELNRAAKAYKSQKGKDVDLADCWDRFFKQRTNKMLETGRKFVNTAIEQMRNKWTHNPEASVMWNAQAQEVRDALETLESHVGEIYMADLELEELS
ncbi:CAZyme family GH18 [Penicillium rubens]|nr:CAZyme family GH18 [Penicillium rubens]